MQPRVKAIISLLLAIATICVYWPVRNHDFVNYDDNDYVTANPHVQAGLTKESVRWAFTEFHGEKTYWHPLTWLSHMVDVELFGLKPGAHHLVSVLFHALNAVLLFLFLASLTGLPWRSALVAALFALHPLQVDTVAWVTERKNILAGLFWILTLWSYVAFTRKRSLSRYWLTLALFILGLMCKPVLVTLPCIMLLLDFWPLKRFVAADVRRRTAATEDEPTTSGWRKLWEKLGASGASNASAPGTGALHLWDSLLGLCVEKIPFFALSLASGLLTIWSHNQLGLREEMYGLPFLLRLENAFVSYARYLGKLAWPNDLCVLYLHPGEWPFETVLLSFLVVAAITALAVWRVRQTPYLLMGWLWFLVVLIPTIGIRQAGVQAMADRFAYLPAIGVFIGMVWGMSELLQRAKFPTFVFPGVAAGCLLFFTWFTVHQIPHWQNSNTLFEQALRVDPKNFVMLHNLGVTLTDQNRLDEALARENACLGIRPEMVPAHVQKGYIHLLQNDPEAARVAYGTALKLQPGSIQMIRRSGLNLVESGQTEKAFGLFSILAQLVPQDADAQFQLGVLYSIKQDFPQSIRSYEEAIRLSPEWPAPMNNLAWILATHPDARFRNGARAVELAEKACRLTGHNTPVMIGTLAAAYAEAGRFGDAARTAEQACEIAMKMGATNLVAENRRLLELYRKQQPVREKG